MLGAESQQNCEDLEAVILSSPLVSKVLDRWGEIGLTNSWLVSGSVIQTYWNYRHEFSPEFGIEDIDLVYYDSSDLSAATEESVETRVSVVLGDLNTAIDVKNEARVHVWYAEKFGFEIPPYKSVTDAIGCFPTVVGSIGVRPAIDGVEVHSVFGLADLYSLTVRPNKRQVTRAVYEAKAARWKAKWPKLKVVEWHDGAL